MTDDPNPTTQTAAQVIRDRQLMVIRDGLAQLTGMYVSRYDALKVMELVVTTMGATVPLENQHD